MSLARAFEARVPTIQNHSAPLQAWSVPGKGVFFRRYPPVALSTVGVDPRNASRIGEVAHGFQTYSSAMVSAIGSAADGIWWMARRV